MRKFRIVKTQYHDREVYYIEEYLTFLWWSWWSYIGSHSSMDGYFAYEFETIDAAKAMIKSWTTPDQVVEMV
jgi:hypothetical protein